MMYNVHDILGYLSWDMYRTCIPTSAKWMSYYHKFIPVRDGISYVLKSLHVYALSKMRTRILYFVKYCLKKKVNLKCIIALSIINVLNLCKCRYIKKAPLRIVRVYIRECILYHVKHVFLS